MNYSVLYANSLTKAYIYLCFAFFKSCRAYTAFFTLLFHRLTGLRYIHALECHEPCKYWPVGYWFKNWQQYCFWMNLAAKFTTIWIKIASTPPLNWIFFCRVVLHKEYFLHHFKFVVSLNVSRSTLMQIALLTIIRKLVNALTIV